MEPQLKEKPSGKFLTFFLGQEEYGTEILKVQEIISMMAITPVPRTPKYVRGVLNLRGMVIPIVDLRVKFGMPAARETKESCIIVFLSQGMRVGIIVDKVSEVLDIPPESIEVAPAFGASLNMDYLLGIGKSHERIQLLLDMEEVLRASEVIDIHSSLQSNIHATIQKARTT